MSVPPNTGELVTPASPDNKADLSLIEKFRLRAGRPLRVLHIGNIANNAYNNACIQRQHGIEADVLCYNYYHIMGCPEWEDSDFREGSSVAGLDHFKPDWWATSLRGWSRPRWFVQGPSALCIDSSCGEANSGRKLLLLSSGSNLNSQRGSTHDRRNAMPTIYLVDFGFIIGSTHRGG